MWGDLLKRYWLVAILKETPANTPHSLFLLSITLIFYLIILLSQWSLMDVKKNYTLLNSILTGLSLLFSYLFYTKILLHLYKKNNRFVQTTTSLLISNLFIHLFAFPFLWIASYFLQGDIQQMDMLLFAIIYILGTFMLSLWQFLIITHIYKCALELNFFSAMLVSFGLLAFNILIVSLWR